MNGIAIPDTVIIRNSNLVERDQIADEVQKLLGQAEPSEQEIAMMEMQQQLQIQTVQAELTKLGKASGDAWDATKTGFSDAGKALSASYDKAAAAFKK